MCLISGKNTFKMQRIVKRAARAHLTGHNKLEVVFEHGQWWAKCICGGIWAVEDASGPGSVEGLCFETIEQGDMTDHE